MCAIVCGDNHANERKVGCHIAVHIAVFIIEGIPEGLQFVEEESLTKMTEDYQVYKLLHACPPYKCLF